MVRKILSSREEPTLTETLQELVFIAEDIAFTTEARDLPETEDPEELSDRLMGALISISEKQDELKGTLVNVTADYMQLSIEAALMVADLKRAARVLDALATPPNDDPIFDQVLSILKREGEAELSMVDDGSHSIEVEVKVTFTEDKLREALKLAIENYNHGKAASVL